MGHWIWGYRATGTYRYPIFRLTPNAIFDAWTWASNEQHGVTEMSTCCFPGRIWPEIPVLFVWWGGAVLRKRRIHEGMLLSQHWIYIRWLSLSLSVLNNVEYSILSPALNLQNLAAQTHINVTLAQTHCYALDMLPFRLTRRPAHPDWPRQLQRRARLVASKHPPRKATWLGREFRIEQRWTKSNHHTSLFVVCSAIWFEWWETMGSNWVPNFWDTPNHIQPGWIVLLVPGFKPTRWRKDIINPSWNVAMKNHHV